MLARTKGNPINILRRRYSNQFLFGHGFDSHRAVARAGIWHKLGMIITVCVAALTDAVLSIAVANLPILGLTYETLVLPVVLVWYIFTELGSIAENAAALGAPVPESLLKLLAVGKSAAENRKD